MASHDLRRFHDAVSLPHRSEGHRKKTVLSVEELSSKNLWRSLVTSRALKAGHVLELKSSRSCATWTRPYEVASSA